MSMTGKKGVDISYANGNINLSKVKAAGYDFVMIRCGYGSDMTSQDDSQFESNVKKAEALGMPWGVYLYSYATNTSEAKSEVEHVKRLLKGKKPTMPVALDVEDSNYYQRHGCYNKSALTAIVRTWIDGIKAAGFYPMLYTGKYWLDSYIDSSVYKNVDIWIACWTTSCLYSGSNLGMWQYGGEVNCIESNSIPGVGTIDKDKCYKDYPSIIKNGNYNGWTGGSGGGSSSGGQEVYCDISMPYLAKSGYISTGEEVKTVQLLMNAMNYGKLTVDGIFGEATDTAVKKFQKSRKLTQDGIVGKDTWKYLLK